MNSDPAKQNAAPDEIDLLALLERALLFIKKNKWTFSIAILLGLMTGYLWYRSLPVVYKSRLILQSFVLTNQNDIQIVSNWNALLKSHDHASLTAILNTPEATLKKLKQIKAEEIQKIFTPNNPNGFLINVFVTDIGVLPGIQKGIVYGFNNSEYVKERLLSKKSRLQDLIDKTSQEINRLDSTKRLIENILAGRGNNVTSLVVDVAGTSRQLVEMNDKLLNLKEELRFNSAVQVLQGFSQFKKPAGPNLILWLLTGSFAGFSAGYAIALFKSLNRSLKTRSRVAKTKISDSVSI